MGVPHVLSFKKNLEIELSSFPFCSQQPFTERYCMLETVLEASIIPNSNDSSRWLILSPLQMRKLRLPEVELLAKLCSHVKLCTKPQGFNE